MTLALTFATTIVAFTGLWLLSLKKRDCGVVDLYWGPGFAVIAWITLARADDAAPLAWLVAIMTTLWAARLGWRLTARHARAAEEDARYAAMRANGGPHYPLMSLFVVFWLQAAVMWVVASPIHAAILSPDPAATGLGSAAMVVGVIFFAVGLTIETVADAALDRFKRDPANAGRLLTTGLFAWSRHPNYFGEAMLWWGIGLVAFAASGSWIAFAGPAILTVLLLKVSGVPMLDAHLSSRPGFADYAARTSAFLPLPPGRGQALRRIFAPNR